MTPGGQFPGVDNLIQWALGKIRALRFGGESLNVYEVAAANYRPGAGLWPHADCWPGISFTLTVRRPSRGFKFMLGGWGGGLTLPPGSCAHDETAIVIDMLPGELWAWNHQEIHSIENNGSEHRSNLLFRACVGEPSVPPTK